MGNCLGAPSAKESSQTKPIEPAKVSEPASGVSVQAVSSAIDSHVAIKDVSSPVVTSKVEKQENTESGVPAQTITTEQITVSNVEDAQSTVEECSTDINGASKSQDASQANVQQVVVSTPPAESSVEKPLEQAASPDSAPAEDKAVGLPVNVVAEPKPAIPATNELPGQQSPAKTTAAQPAKEEVSAVSEKLVEAASHSNTSSTSSGTVPEAVVVKEEVKNADSSQNPEQSDKPAKKASAAKNKEAAAENKDVLATFLPPSSTTGGSKRHSNGSKKGGKKKK